MNGKQILGIAVITIASGEKVGTVDKIYLDPAARQIQAFAVRSGGLIGGKETCIVRANDTRSLGPDALTLPDDSVLHDETEQALGSGVIKLEDLLKRKVVTEGGTFVGDVAGIEFDPDDLKLTAVEVSPGFFKTNKLVPNNQVTSIGPDVLIVNDAVCASPPEDVVNEPGWPAE